METRTRAEAKAATNDIKAVGRCNTQGVRVGELITCVCVHAGVCWIHMPKQLLRSQELPSVCV